MLVVEVLRADPFEVGLVNAAQFVPYAVLGLIAGVYVDRWRRRRILVIASLGRAVSLVAIVALWAVGALPVWVLIALLLAFGSFAVFGFAASQSLLPRIVSREKLLRANARLDQGEAAAQTVGPTLAGVIVRWLGAPVALLIDAVTYLVDALIVARIPVDENPRHDRVHLRRDIAAGLSATYRHRVLAPLAVSTHIWFVANAASLTLLSLLALRTLDLGAAVFGLLVSCVGAATLIGASGAERLGERFGEGATITAARLIYPLAWCAVAVVPTLERGAAIGMLFAALAATGLAAGVENANEMSYRQQTAPDELLGRVNATGRSVNRTAAALGALLGGLLAAQLGVATALWVVVALFAGAALVAALSPVRSARAGTRS